MTPFNVDSSGYSELLGLLFTIFGVFGGITASFVFKGASIARFKFAVTMAGLFSIISLIYFAIALQTM